MNNQIVTSTLCYLVFSLVTTSVTIAQNAPLWSAEFDRNLNWMELTDAGYLLVNTNDAMYGVDPESGDLLWSIEELRRTDNETVEMLEATPFFFAVGRGLGTLKPYYMIDSMTGEIIVNTKDYDVDEVADKLIVDDIGGILIAENRKSTLIMVNIADGSVMWRKERAFDGNVNVISYVKVFGKRTDDETTSSFLMYKDETFLMLTNRKLYRVNAITGDYTWEYEVRNGEYVGYNSDGSTIYISSGRNLLAIDGDTGKALWNNPPRLRGENITEVYNTSTGLIVQTDDKNRKLYKIDYATGEQIWDAPRIKNEIAFIIVEEGFGAILVTFDKSVEVSLLDMHSGIELWSEKINGDVQEISKVPAGVLVITNQEVNIHEASTGKQILDRRDIRSRSGDIVSLKEEQRRIIYTEGKIVDLDINNAGLSVLAEDINLNGNEKPHSISKMDYGYLLTSSQNLLLLNQDFSVKKHTYLNPPGRSALSKIGMGLTAVASTYAAAQSLKGSYNARSQRVGNYTMVTYERNPNSQRLAQGFAGAAGSSLRAMGDRFKASHEAENYVYILADDLEYDGESGIGLAKVSKLTGEIEDQVVIKDRSPEYIVDEITGMIYYQSKRDMIWGYKL